MTLYRYNKRDHLFTLLDYIRRNVVFKIDKLGIFSLFLCIIMFNRVL